MRKTLGTLISETRKEKGMTQLELAQKMNVTDKAVSKWERDLSCPDVNSLPLLAEVLGLTLEELMQGKKENQPAAHKYSELVDTIMKAVALAIGVATVVLVTLNTIAPQQGVLLLGIGLVCLAISSLGRK